MKDPTTILISAELAKLGYSQENTLAVNSDSVANRDDLFFSNTICYDGVHILDSIIFFKFSPSCQLYMPDRVSAKVYPLSHPEAFSTHTFPLADAPPFTQKEIFNLFQGRYVHKDHIDEDGLSFGRWYYLQPSSPGSIKDDRLQRINKTSYDLEKVLSAYPIADMENNVFRRCLILSLKKGDLQLVTFRKKDKREPMFIEAAPLFMRINLYSPAVMARKIDFCKGKGRGDIERYC